jgi:hypothetical protein
MPRHRSTPRCIFWFFTRSKWISTQRPKLRTFTKACCTRADKLRRDACGDWAIFGKWGHIYAVLEGYQLMIFKSSAVGWTRAKQRLDFGKAYQSHAGSRSRAL